MKKIITGILLLISINIYSQIDFKDLTSDKEGFKTILKEAKNQNKLVFIYFSSSWCAPCKKFERIVLSDKKVYSFYENNFINTKVIWERKEPFLNKKYKINGFPQYLFIDSKGDIIHHIRYYQDVDDFLTIGQQAISKDDNLVGWKKKINDGVYSFEIVSKYLKTLEKPQAFKDKNYKCESQYLLDKYFATQAKSTWINFDNWNLIKDYIAYPHSEQFEYVMDNYQHYVEEYDKIEVDRYIFDTWFDYTSGCSNCSDRFKKANEEIKQIEFPPIKAVLARRPAWDLDIEIYREKDNAKKDSLTYALYHSIKQPFNDYYYLYPAKQINSWTWQVYEYAKKSKNEEILLSASEWMEKLISITQYFEVFDTYSHILSELGKKDKALVMQKKALQMAELSHEPDKILQRINKRINELEGK